MNNIPLPLLIIGAIVAVIMILMICKLIEMIAKGLLIASLIAIPILAAVHFKDGNLLEKAKPLVEKVQTMAEKTTPEETPKKAKVKHEDIFSQNATDALTNYIRNAK